MHNSVNATAVEDVTILVNASLPSTIVNSGSYTRNP